VGTVAGGLDSRNIVESRTNHTAFSLICGKCHVTKTRDKNCKAILELMQTPRLVIVAIQVVLVAESLRLEILVI
jgi:hypothetical protein